MWGIASVKLRQHIYNENDYLEAKLLKFCPSWLCGRGNLLGLRLGRQEGGVAPHVSCSVLAPSAVSVPVLSLALALWAALAPAPLVLALSPVPFLTLIVSLALLFSLALTVMLV